MIKSIQKVIKIGSSGGVTIPAKEMKRLGVTFFAPNNQADIFTKNFQLWK